MIACSHIQANNPGQDRLPRQLQAAFKSVKGKEAGDELPKALKKESIQKAYKVHLLRLLRERLAVDSDFAQPEVQARYPASSKLLNGNSD
ncbi:MAG TPA: hypothetical protein V6D20_12860 [Candidatus Obscuribacterales bacterium]